MNQRCFKFFSKNLHGRDFVVGDIHGCFSALECLLKQNQFNPQIDRLFAIGDLIDRGPEPLLTFRYLNYPWFHSILGNHEKMLIDAVENPVLEENWTRQNGGDWWLNIPQNLRHRIYSLFKQLPIAIEIETNNHRIGLVHADIPPEMSWKQFIQLISYDKSIVEYALWSRNRYKQLKITGNTPPIPSISWVVFGHTPLSKPVQVANCYYIDTGAALVNDPSLGHLTLLQIHPHLMLSQFDLNTRQSINNVPMPSWQRALGT